MPDAVVESLAWFRMCSRLPDVLSCRYDGSEPDEPDCPPWLLVGSSRWLSCVEADGECESDTIRLAMIL